LPSAVRIFFGMCAIVFFLRATAIAFRMLRRAARRCFGVAVAGCLLRKFSEAGSGSSSAAAG